MLNYEPDKRMGGFETTHWSTVVAAGGPSTKASQEALATLCQTYWYPLYAYLRRRGHTMEDAEDLTQGFFAHLLEKRALKAADPHRGRFRSFLLASLQHYVSHARDFARAEKRGGSIVFLPLELEGAEQRYRRGSPDDSTPEVVFDQRWAVSVLDRVAATLRAEFRQRGKEAVFEGLREHLTGDDDLLSYREIGLRLGLSEGAARVAVHRLRRRFRELLRSEIAHTVSSPGEVSDEIQYLIRALAG